MKTFISTSFLGLVAVLSVSAPQEAAAQAVVFRSGFEYSGGEPLPSDIGLDAAGLNGADGQIGTFSGAIPGAAGGEFEPDVMGFADHPGPNQFSRLLWFDRPLDDGSFFADLASDVLLDGATFSFEVGTRRTNGDNHDKDYDIIGLDSGGNESFRLRISGSASLMDQDERVGVVTDNGATVTWDLPTVAGDDSDQDLDNLSATFDPGEIGIISLSLASDGYVLDFQNFVPGAENAYTTDTLSYNGSATELSRIEFTIAGDAAANNMRGGYVLDNLNVMGIPTGVFVLGDFNSDTNVDEDDYFILAGNLGEFNVAYEGGDINFDNQVDLADFGEFKDLFPAVVAQAQLIPEPSSVALAAFALAALVPRRRRKCGLSSL